MTKEEFVKEAIKIHGNRYDYSKVEFLGVKKKVCIICPIHGEFWQVAYSHLKGHGCSKCAGVGRLTTEEFVQRAKQVHGDKYDYSKTEYVNARTKVCIICHKKNRNGIEHGEFWQTPNEHIHGRGCPKCRNSYLERTISIFLEENGIKYFKEKTFPWLRKNKNSPLFLDFYLPDYNVAIECQGVQHFMPIKNNVDKFEKIKFNDRFKKEKCEENGIKLLYFSHEIISKNYTNEYIIFNKDELLNKIRNA